MCHNMLLRASKPGTRCMLFCKSAVLRPSSGLISSQMQRISLNNFTKIDLLPTKRLLSHVGDCGHQLPLSICGSIERPAGRVPRTFLRNVPHLVAEETQLHAANRHIPAFGMSVQTVRSFASFAELANRSRRVI